MKSLTKLYYLIAALCVLRSVEKDLKRYEDNRSKLAESSTRARKNYDEVVRVYEKLYGDSIK